MCGHCEHQGLSIHTDVRRRLSAKDILHAEKRDMRRIEQFKITQTRTAAARLVFPLDAHCLVKHSRTVTSALLIRLAKAALVFMILSGGLALADAT